eukprot:364988-Chlamydomonas_euryale.AAC.10
MPTPPLLAPRPPTSRSCGSGRSMRRRAPLTAPNAARSSHHFASLAIRAWPELKTCTPTAKAGPKRADVEARAAVRDLPPPLGEVAAGAWAPRSSSHGLVPAFRK